MTDQEVLSAALRTIVEEYEAKETEGYRVKAKARKKPQSAPAKSTGAVRKAESDTEDESE